jgi:hypothetical protein
MKIKYYFLLLMLLFVLPSCGSDTNGTLSLTTPSVTGGSKIGDVATVIFTVSYSPPPGKSPNGEKISTIITDGSGNVLSSYEVTLGSNTSYSDSLVVTATNAEQVRVIRLSIGGMTAGSPVTIPAGT